MIQIYKTLIAPQVKPEGKCPRGRRKQIGETQIDEEEFLLDDEELLTDVDFLLGPRELPQVNETQVVSLPPSTSFQDGLFVDELFCQ